MSVVQVIVVLGALGSIPMPYETLERKESTLMHMHINGFKFRDQFADEQFRPKTPLKCTVVYIPVYCHFHLKMSTSFYRDNILKNNKLLFRYLNSVPILQDGGFNRI